MGMSRDGKATIRRGQDTVNTDRITSSNPNLFSASATSLSALILAPKAFTQLWSSRPITRLSSSALKCEWDVTGGERWYVILEGE
jgi:hypothetical protein